MKSRITTACLAVAVCLWAAPAVAQEHRPHEGHGHDPAAHLEHLQETLELTDAQVAQIEPIVVDAMERHEAIREEGHDEAMHERMLALHEETMARISEVLTEEQRAKLEEMHREMMERHGRGHGPR